MTLKITIAGLKRLAEAEDAGPSPFAVDINKATLSNKDYRNTIWTGSHLQVTVMSIEPGKDIGLEDHHKHDQFLRVESGRARIQMGKSKDKLTFDREVEGDWAILIPANTWHNIENIGEVPLKLYSVYGPAKHPHGTVHPTKEDADADEDGKPGD